MDLDIRAEDNPRGAYHRPQDSKKYGASMVEDLLEETAGDGGEDLAPIPGDGAIGPATAELFEKIAGEGVVAKTGFREPGAVLCL
jgi:hypothetical protein